VSIGLPVSIPYLRVTHPQRDDTAIDWEPCFNPLSTGHAPRITNHRHYPNQVSIPYLRVTHCTLAGQVPPNPDVSIPYLRVTHQNPVHGESFIHLFQSPIYGSRTFILTSGQITGHRFQSPIYGSRTHESGHSAAGTGGVSIPYLRVTHEVQLLELRKLLKGFNPLSTGHALKGCKWYT